MTERTGGSDVSQTETVATYDPYPEANTAPLADIDERTPLGPWSISGFKWFSSATDSQMTILLAKTSLDKGVSAFFAPMRRYNPSLVSATGQKGGTELNGVTIQRLKSKFGTQSLPTAEFELKGMRGWLIGEEGKGIQEISTILNITRVHTTVSSVGYLGRSLAIAKAFALVREAGVGKGRRLPLSSHPLHMRTLANLTVDYHAMMLLVFYTLYILGLDERRSLGSALSASPMSNLAPPPHLITPLLRVISSLHKSYVCENAVPAVYACMEALGGVGYLVNSESEHLNVARIFRDACVGAIWEGTTDVLAGDTVRALKHPTGGKESLKAVDWVVRKALSPSATLSSSSTSSIFPPKTLEATKATIARKWEDLRTNFAQETQADLLPDARQLVFQMAEVLIAALFLVDVATAQSGMEIEAMCAKYLAKKGFMNGVDANGGGIGAKQTLELDQSIVYSEGRDLEAALASSKL